MEWNKELYSIKFILELNPFTPLCFLTIHLEDSNDTVINYDCTACRHSPLHHPLYPASPPTPLLPPLMFPYSPFR